MVLLFSIDWRQIFSLIQYIYVRHKKTDKKSILTKDVQNVLYDLVVPISDR